MKIIKHTNTMKKGESYTLNVVRVDELIRELNILIKEDLNSSLEDCVLHSGLNQIIEELKKANSEVPQR